jgi:hypothetical protein
LAILILLWLVALLLLLVAPVALLLLKLTGVLPAPWEQVWKHCGQSVIVGAVLLCLAIYMYRELRDAFAPLAGH